MKAVTTVQQEDLCSSVVQLSLLSVGLAGENSLLDCASDVHFPGP